MDGKQRFRTPTKEAWELARSIVLCAVVAVFATAVAWSFAHYVVGRLMTPS